MAIATRVRAIVAIALVAAALVAAHALGLFDALSIASVRGTVERAGVYGPLAFSGLFVAATLAQIPGVPFIILAPALFSTSTALVISLASSHVAVAINFELVRRVGGTPLKALRHPWLVRLFAQLEAAPVRTVALLRALTIMFPPVTSALALTTVGRRSHFLGTLLGMTPPVFILLLVSAWLIQR